MARNRRVARAVSDTLAKNLKRLRKKHGLTQQLLAERANVHRATIASIEGARYSDQRASTIEALALALGEPSTELLGS